MTVIYRDVKTLTEIQSVTGQQTKALVMYDTSTGEATGLDVEVLIKLDAEKADTTQVEALADVDKANYAKSVEMIAHNATAPSPNIPTGTTKTYEFSTGGECTWITGGPVTVEVGDMVSAAFTEPSTWVYTYQNVLKRKADASVIGDINTILDNLNGEVI